MLLEMMVLGKNVATLPSRSGGNKDEVNRGDIEIKSVVTG
jgi:hypothetical protein